MVYFNQKKRLPLARTASVMGDLYDLPVFPAAVLKAGEEAAARLKPTVNSIAEHLKNSAVLTCPLPPYQPSVGKSGCKFN